MSDSAVKDSIDLRPHDQTGRTARQFVVRTLRRWRVVELIFRASQVVTDHVERVAARSGRDMKLVLIREPRSVRIEVSDGSEADPASTAEVNRQGCRGYEAQREGVVAVQDPSSGSKATEASSCEWGSVRRSSSARCKTG